MICCKETSNQFFEIRFYDSPDSLIKIRKSNLTVNTANDHIEYTYKDVLVPESVCIRQNRYYDSILRYHNIDIPLIDSKDFFVGTQTVQIRKYQYDLLNSLDEEESIYFLDNYGIIAIRLNAWGYHYIFDNGDTNTRKLIDLILKDTTGFYGYPKPTKK